MGTTVEVKDLFFNVPARRRFLKSEKTEFSRILQTVSHLALSRFDFEISLRRDGRLVKTVRIPADPDEDIIRVGSVVGGSFAEEAVRVSEESAGTELKGWIMMPDPEGGSAPDEYFFVNGRAVRDRLLMHAVRQAATEITGKNAVPSYVLYLKIDPHDVDVNVHPTKHEVRFAEARSVHDLVVLGVRNAFAGVYGQSPRATWTPWRCWPSGAWSSAAPRCGENMFRERREGEDLFSGNRETAAPGTAPGSGGAAPAGAPLGSASGSIPSGGSGKGEDSWFTLRVRAGGAGSGAGTCSRGGRISRRLPELVAAVQERR